MDVLPWTLPFSEQIAFEYYGSARYRPARRKHWLT